MVKDRSGDSNRPLSTTKQRNSEDVFERKEIAATGSSAEQRLPHLASKPAQSLQGLLTTSGPSIYPITGTSTSSRTYEGSCLFEDLKDRSITPPESVEPSRSLSSKPERDCQSSKYCPSVTADQCSNDAGDSPDLDHCDTISNGIDEELSFNTQYPDLYFSTGIDI